MNEKRRRLLQSAVDRGKYRKLYRFLKALENDRWHATFKAVEEVLGFELPDSARLYRPWWANQSGKGSHTQALSWEMAGWKTAQVDMEAETLVFERVGLEQLPANDGELTATRV